MCFLSAVRTMACITKMTYCCCITKNAERCAQFMHSLILLVSTTVLYQVLCTAVEHAWKRTNSQPLGVGHSTPWSPCPCWSQSPQPNPTQPINPTQPKLVPMHSPIVHPLCFALTVLLLYSNENMACCSLLESSIQGDVHPPHAGVAAQVPGDHRGR